MCEEFLLKDESPVTVGGNLVKAESLHGEEEKLQASPVLLFRHQSQAEHLLVLWRSFDRQAFTRDSRTGCFRDVMCCRVALLSTTRSRVNDITLLNKGREIGFALGNKTYRQLRVAVSINAINFFASI